MLMYPHDPQERTAKHRIGCRCRMEYDIDYIGSWPTPVPRSRRLMAKLSFGAQIAAFAEKVPEAAEAVFKESAADVVREMQTLTSEGGRMRYKTGFLWSSLMASASVDAQGSTQDRFRLKAGRTRSSLDRWRPSLPRRVSTTRSILATRPPMLGIASSDRMANRRMPSCDRRHRTGT
jgi:hypothetical protein